MTCAKLFLGLKGALLNNNFLALFNMTNQDIPQTFQVLVDVLSGTTFAFLPAIVCWSTFRVFGGSPVLGLIPGLMLVNGPLLHALENVLLVIVEAALGLPMGLGGLVVGFFWSIITLTGVHHINMLEISLLASTGFNPFNAILCMCGFSSAGVCLAISLKAKKKEIRAIGPSATASALLGIGEPALFGVILRYGLKPFLLSCSINGIAGMTAMLLGMKGTGNGITTIPGMLLYIYSPSQILMYVILALKA